MSEMFIFVSFKTANLLLINSQCYKHSENGPAHRVRGGGGIDRYQGWHFLRICVVICIIALDLCEFKPLLGCYKGIRWTLKSSNF